MSTFLDLFGGAKPLIGMVPLPPLPGSPRHDGYRIPRVVVDICGARPIDLAIIDGVATMAAAEDPGQRSRIVAGDHPVFAGLDAAALETADDWAARSPGKKKTGWYSPCQRDIPKKNRVP